MNAGWIIETNAVSSPSGPWLECLFGGQPSYVAIQGGMRWTHDSAQALRFARKSDAVSFASLMVPGAVRFHEITGESDA